MGYIDTEVQCRIVPKGEYRSFLRDRFSLTKYKIDTLIDTYKMLGLVKEEKGNYLFFPVRKNFVSLNLSTTLFFLNHLSPFCFKTYCWLLNKYDLHNAYFRHGENYFFNLKELLEGIGYSYNNRELRDRLKEALCILEKLGYIEYNHEYVGRPGHHGLYLELYKVYKYGKTQIKANKEVVKGWIESGTEISISRALTVLNPETKDDLEYLLKKNLITGADDIIESKALVEEIDMYDELNKRLQVKN